MDTENNLGLELPDNRAITQKLKSNSAQENKKNKLIAFANSILRHPFYKKDFAELMVKLNLTEEQVMQSFLDYNMDIYAADNEIYNSIPNRIVLHIHNLIADSWHQDRQLIIMELLKLTQANTLIDIGFGVPTKYIKELILKNKIPKTTLCDLFDTAFQFAEILLSQWDNKWMEVISFKQTDMNNVDSIGNFDVYLFQDSIEHVADPTTCLSNYVQRSQKNSKFILSLPIGPIFPRHYIAWLTDNDAIMWLKNCGLKVDCKKSVWVNLSVDLFAEQLGKDYHNLIVLCSKTNYI